MPTYTFRRPTDGQTITRRLSFTEYDAVMAGSMKVTDEEGTTLEIVFNPGRVGFVMKDGPSGSFPSKVLKEGKYRAARSTAMGKREKDHVFKSKLVPNYQGQEAHSWSDVRDHVRSTKGSAAASTYDSLVSKERTS